MAIVLEDNMRNTADILDRTIPLVGASHADVIDYSIVIPMRYAECVANLIGGGQTRFRNPRQLTGWSGPAERRTFVFQSGNRGIEIAVNTARKRRVRTIHVCQMAIVEQGAAPTRRLHKLITRDGGLLFAAQTARERLKKTSKRNKEPRNTGGLLEGLLTGSPA